MWGFFLLHELLYIKGILWFQSFINAPWLVHPCQMWSTGTGTKHLCGVKQRNNLMRSPHSSLSLLGHISSQKIHKGERPPNAVKRGKMQRNDAPV